MAHERSGISTGRVEAEALSLAGLDAIINRAHGGMCRQHRTFLPAVQITQMFTGKVDRTVRSIENVVAEIARAR